MKEKNKTINFYEFRDRRSLVSISFFSQCAIVSIFVIALVAPLRTTYAATLSQVKDTISTSAPSVSANHTIQFTTATEIPASGKIIITPETGDFTVPSELDYTDIDLSDDGTDLTLSSSAGSGSGSAIGVSVTTGTSGSITFTLNNTDVIAAGSAIVIEIGTNATAGGTGDKQITNPSTITSYIISIETRNSGGTTLDSGTAMIAIVNQVTASAGKKAEPVIVQSTTGGLGGSSVEHPPTNITFEGEAPSESIVVLLKDGEIVTSTRVSETNSFSVILKNIQSAMYSFTLYLVDQLGRVSAPIELKTSAPIGKTTEVKNILLPPTISVEKEKVTQGEPVIVRGESIPKSSVLVKVRGEEVPIGSVTADEEGRYEFEISTETVREGIYEIRTHAEKDGKRTPESAPIKFQVSGPIKKALPTPTIEKLEKIPQQRPKIQIPEEVQPESLPSVELKKAVTSIINSAIGKIVLIVVIAVIIVYTILKILFRI